MMILSLVLDLIIRLICQLFISNKHSTHLYSSNPLVHEMAKNNLKNADHSFTEPKITSSDFLCGPANGPKPKDSSFTIINDEKSSI